MQEKERTRSDKMKLLIGFDLFLIAQFHLSCMCLLKGTSVGALLN
ncbi:hypothetical protein BTH41_01536 [Bacillus mycoides]|nr:hypothetical protein BTH41_01536 [Bacillus mycoides]